MPSLDFTSAAVRTRSPRKLAGSRANKRYVIVGTRDSDRSLADSERMYRRLSDDARQLAVSEPELGGLALMLAPVYHDIPQGSKPDHPFRAVDIDACFGARLPVGDSAKAAAARRAGDCGRSGATSTVGHRLALYASQTRRHQPHRFTAGWGGVRGGCGAECACGLTYDGFDTLKEPGDMIDRHAARFARVTPAQRRRLLHKGRRSGELV